MTTREIPLDYRVESLFRGEFVYEPESRGLFKGSDVERCFGYDLYPPPSPPDMSEEEHFWRTYAEGQGWDSDDLEIWEMLQGRDPYD